MIFGAGEADDNYRVGDIVDVKVNGAVQKGSVNIPIFRKPSSTATSPR
jgi:ribosomal protein L21E